MGMSASYPRKLIAAVLFLVTAVAAAGTGCHLMKLLGPAEYGRIISSDPYDAMGAEFRETFGRFLYTHSASPDNLRALTDAAFAERLAIAKKYKTFFARQMEPVAPDGTVVRRWRERLTGATRLPCWSFGIPGDARPREVWEFFNKRLDPKNAREEKVDRRIFAGLPGKLPTDDKRALVWDGSVGDPSYNE